MKKVFKDAYFDNLIVQNLTAVNLKGSTPSSVSGSASNLYKFNEDDDELVNNGVFSVEFQTDEKVLSDIDYIYLNNVNLSGQDLSVWHRVLSDYSQPKLLDLVNVTNPQINGKYLIRDVNLESDNTFEYRDFHYSYLRFAYSNDPSITQIFIYNGFPSFEWGVDTDIESATLSGLNDNLFYIAVYNKTCAPLSLEQMDDIVKRYIDNVVYAGNTTATQIADIEDMRSNFYSRYSNVRGDLDLYVNFDLFGSGNGDDYSASPEAPFGDVNLYVVYYGREYIIQDINNGGSGYTSSNIGQNMTILGSNLGGTDGINDLVVKITGVSGGAVSSVSIVSGIPDYLRLNYINDGGDDQYDGGNYLNTNGATQISYARGTIVPDEVFGSGSKYCVVYNDSIFSLIVTGNTNSQFWLSGGIGADSDTGIMDGGTRREAQYIEFELQPLYANGSFANNDIFSISVSNLQDINVPTDDPGFVAKLAEKRAKHKERREKKKAKKQGKVKPAPVKVVSKQSSKVKEAQRLAPLGNSGYVKQVIRKTQKKNLNKSIGI